MTILVTGADGPELVLYGYVGDFAWNDDTFCGFTSGDVVAALAQVGRGNAVTVRLNSAGGDASEGIAIYNALRAQGAKITVIVDGIALSSASVIAMAGDAITMRTGAIMMIHDPSTITLGDASDHRKSMASLEACAESMAQIYAARTGKPVAETRTLMQAETWMTADQAVAAGFADGEAPEQAAEVTAFDYRLYAKAPQQLVALASAKGWELPRAAAASWSCGAAADLPIDEADSWSGADAAERILADAGFNGDDPDPAKARKGFLAWDSANPKLKGSYKLPFADIVGGTLKAMAGGLRAAASRLPQSDIPQSVQDDARKVLDGYFDKLHQQQEAAMADDDKKAGAAEATARATTIIEACTKAGFTALATPLIKAGADDARVTTALAEASAMKGRFDGARRASPKAIAEDLFDKHLAAGKPVADFSGVLLDAMNVAADEQPNIRSQHTGGDGKPSGGIDTAKIYASHNSAFGRRAV